MGENFFERMSGKRGLLPAHNTVTSLHAPLRIVHVTFTTYGSSISKALFQDPAFQTFIFDYGLAYDNLDGEVLDFHLCRVRHPFSRLCGVYAIHFLLLYVPDTPDIFRFVDAIDHKSCSYISAFPSFLSLTDVQNTFPILDRMGWHYL